MAHCADGAAGGQFELSANAAWRQRYKKMRHLPTSSEDAGTSGAPNPRIKDRLARCQRPALLRIGPSQVPQSCYCRKNPLHGASATRCNDSSSEDWGKRGIGSRDGRRIPDKMRVEASAGGGFCRSGFLIEEARRSDAPPALRWRRWPRDALACGRRASVCKSSEWKTQCCPWPRRRWKRASWKRLAASMAVCWNLTRNPFGRAWALARPP